MLHFYGLLCGVHPFSWSQKHSQMQDGTVISKSPANGSPIFLQHPFPLPCEVWMQASQKHHIVLDDCQVPNRRPFMASVPYLLFHIKMFNYLEILLLVLPFLMMHIWKQMIPGKTERAQHEKSISETAEQVQHLLLLLGGTFSLSESPGLEKKNFVFKGFGFVFPVSRNTTDL